MTGTAHAPRGPSTVILGTVMLNGGDAALLAGQVALLREALGDVEPVIFDYQAGLAAARYPELDVRQSPCSTHGPSSAVAKARLVVRLGRMLLGAVLLGRALEGAGRRVAGRESYDALRAYRAADLVLTCGGTFLVPRYSPYARYVDYACTYLLGRPLVFFTQGFEPATSRVHRTLLRRLLSRAALVIARGERSAAVARSLGATSPIVAADAAFALADADLARAGPVRTVAISVREWPYAEAGRQAAYERAVGVLVEHLVDRGVDVRFTSTCQGEPGYRYDDSVVAERIVQRLPGRVRARVRIDRAFNRWDDLRAQLRDVDLLVATRLHAAILAIGVGTPVLPIAYEGKTHEVFDQLGLGAHVVDLERLQGEDLVQAFEAFRAELPSIARRLDERLPLVRASARAPAPALAALVGSRVPR